MPTKIDLTGMKFGRLTVIERELHSVWLCKCACGKTHRASTSNLRNGHSRSCGCRFLEREEWQKGPPIKDISGQRFGRLLVTRNSGKKHPSNNASLWECQCDCGNTSFVLASNLRKGATQSCGCLQRELSARRLTTHGRARSPEYRKLKSLEYWARKQHATVMPIDTEDLQLQIEELGNHCVYCGGSYEHLDHFIPLSKGGGHELTNLVPACANCNQVKNDRYPGTEWWPPLWTMNQTAAALVT